MTRIFAIRFLQFTVLFTSMFPFTANSLSAIVPFTPLETDSDALAVSRG